MRPEGKQAYSLQVEYSSCSLVVSLVCGMKGSYSQRVGHSSSNAILSSVCIDTSVCPLCHQCAWHCCKCQQQ